MNIRTPSAMRRIVVVSLAMLAGTTIAQGETNYPLVALPYVHIDPLPITQSFVGGRRTSHDGPKSRYAVDIAMPVGTPVLAAMDGIVMDVVEHHRAGGRNRALSGRDNYLTIAHANGTTTMYNHLRHRGIHVAPGDRVSAGQHVADSGNTGYSTGPHLHFAVLERTGAGSLRSIPFLFASHGIPRAGDHIDAFAAYHRNPKLVRLAGGKHPVDRNAVGGARE